MQGREKQIKRTAQKIKNSKTNTPTYIKKSLFRYECLILRTCKIPTFRHISYEIDQSNRPNKLQLLFYFCVGKPFVFGERVKYFNDTNCKPTQS